MRHLLFWTLVLWLVAGLGLGILFLFTPYEQLVAAVRQPNYAAEYSIAWPALPRGQYQALPAGLLVLAGLSGVGLAALRRGRAARHSTGARLRAGARQAWVSLLHPWRQLTTGQRTLALLLGGAALGVRGWLLASQPITTDELTSYDYYVRPGLALTASSYSLPNNHILYNLLVGSLPTTGLPPDLVQRLPAVGVGLGLLPLSYLLLLRHARFGVATLALGWFTFAPMPAFYSIAGRGYGLQLAAVLAGFFATLALLGSGRRRLPWLVFVGSGVVGLYTVPTHLYALLAFGVGLLVGFGRQANARQKWLSLGRLVLATGSVAATTAVLYAPVSAVSGWQLLLRNPYVQPLSWAQFWRGVYDPYLLGMASQLWGQGRASLLGLAILAGVGPVVVRRLRGPAQRLGWLSYAVVFLPLPLLLAQRVYVPARALLPSALFSFVLLALVLQAALAGPAARLRTQWPRWWRLGYVVGLFVIISAYGFYRLRREAVGMQATATRYQHLRRQAAWLRARHPTRVWLDSLSRPYQGLYWYHEGLVRHQPPLPLAVAHDLPTVAASGAGEYAVFYRLGGTLPPAALAARPPAYADKYIYVWQLPVAPQK